MTKLVQLKPWPEPGQSHCWAITNGLARPGTSLHVNQTHTAIKPSSARKLSPVDNEGNLLCTIVPYICSIHMNGKTHRSGEMQMKVHTPMNGSCLLHLDLSWAKWAPGGEIRVKAKTEVDAQLHRCLEISYKLQGTLMDQTTLWGRWFVHFSDWCIWEWHQENRGTMLFLDGDDMW